MTTNMTTKRIFDLTATYLGLSLSLPFMGVIALLVKLTSPGPVLFQQDRVGLGGRVFRIYKFRTMVNRAEEMGTTVTTRKDPRITPVGKILRKFKLDELPQLLNVIKGDMSLVGPRPDVPDIMGTLSPEIRRIFQIRPGITSVATLHLKDEEVFLSKIHEPDIFYQEVLLPLKIKLALEHVDRDSFVFDMKILLQTLWMITPCGKLCPIKEHPLITQLKDRFYRSSNNKFPQNLDSLLIQSVYPD